MGPMLGRDSGDPRSPLTHPIWVGALALLLVNDHVLKSAWPGLVTGKASDVAALVLVPPLVVELVGAARRGRMGTRTRQLLATAAALGIAAWFAAVKLHPVPNEMYAVAMGLVQWPARLLADLFAGLPLAALLPAPTVLDPGDLVALPAAAVGWWIGAGSPAFIRRPRLGTQAPAATIGLRIALAAAATFALAATSYAGPTEITDIARDEVALGPGDAPITRQATVRIRPTLYPPTPSEAASRLEIVIEARPRWPFVDPAPEFAIGRQGESPPPASTASRLTVDPTACGEECSVDVTVAIDWPAPPDRTASSVAWELAATLRARTGTVSGSINVDGAGLVDRTGLGQAVWLLVLLAIPSAAIVIGDRLRLNGRPPGRGVNTAVDAAVLAAGGLLAASLLLLPVLIPPERLEPAAGTLGQAAVFGGVAFGVAVLGGLVLWWKGEGGVLAIVVLAGLLLGLLFAARLFVQASETFFARGLQLAVGATLLAGVALAGGIARRSPGAEPSAPPQPPGQLLPSEPSQPPESSQPPDPPPPSVATSRLVVAAILVALTVGLLPLAPLLAFPLGLAVALWWVGSGLLLGIMSVVIAGLIVGLWLIGGATLFGGPRWGELDKIGFAACFLAAAVGLFAALGVVGRHPARPAGRPVIPISEAGPPVG
jgi:hypothetical protein